MWGQTSVLRTQTVLLILIVAGAVLLSGAVAGDPSENVSGNASLEADELVDGQVTDEDGDFQESGFVRLERLSDGSSEISELTADGIFSFDDESFLEPGTYRLEVWPDDGYPPYWGYETFELSEGDRPYFLMERGGVYVTDQVVTDQFDSISDLQSEPGEDIDVQLSIDRPRHGERVSVETYFYPVGDEPDPRPDDTYSRSQVPQGTSTIEFDVSAPITEGEYEVEFVVITEFDHRGETITDSVSGPEVQVSELNAPEIDSSVPETYQQTLVGYDTLEFSISASSTVKRGDKLTTEWYVNDEYVSAGDSLEMDGADYEIGDHTVEAVVSDGLDETTDSTETWNVSVTKPPSPTVDRVLPDSNSLEVRSGESVAFEIEAASDTDADLELQWYENGNHVESGHEFDRTFDTAGEHTVTAVATDPWGSSTEKRWSIDVTSFRESPEIRDRTSVSQVAVDESTEFVTQSVRNPEVNDRTAVVETIVDIPSGVELTTARDVSEGNAGSQALVETVEPATSESMELGLRVTDESLIGETIRVPYQVRYYPEGVPDDFTVLEDTTEEIRVVDSADEIDSNDDGIDRGDDEAARDDGSPGFTPGTALVVLSLLSLGLALRRERST